MRSIAFSPHDTLKQPQKKPSNSWIKRPLILTPKSSRLRVMQPTFCVTKPEAGQEFTSTHQTRKEECPMNPHVLVWKQSKMQFHCKQKLQRWIKQQLLPSPWWMQGSHSRALAACTTAIIVHTPALATQLLSTVSSVVDHLCARGMM